MEKILNNRNRTANLNVAHMSSLFPPMPESKVVLVIWRGTRSVDPFVSPSVTGVDITLVVCSKTEYVDISMVDRALLVVISFAGFFFSCTLFTSFERK